MKASIKTIKTIILELTEEERDWLNAAMQNPLNGKSPDDESFIDAEMRRNFFNATRPQS